MYTLAETELVKVQQSEFEDGARFVIEPLLPGFGVTVGNALRRVLLSSLKGSAITTVRIEGITHEFATLKGVREDVVNIILNLKTVRLKLEGEEPVTLTLTKKTAGPVTVADFDKNARIEFTDPNHVICTLEKGGSFTLEVTVERGRGYVPTESRQGGKLPIGVIAIDSIFTPMKKVHYEVENTRVEGMTNFDRLTLDVETDKTISPVEAMRTAVAILTDHFNLITNQIPEETVGVAIKPKKEKAPAVKKVAAKPSVKKSTKK